LAEFLAPYDYREQVRAEPSAPPSKLHVGLGSVWVHRRQLVDPLRLIYVDDDSIAHPTSFFVRGHSYRLLGMIETDIHLFGTAGEGAPRVNLLGTDILGRDRFTRLMHAIRYTLSVC
jgi:peptide/nickel transport system permease protein